GALLLLSLWMLPITPSEALKPLDGDNPIGRILLLLAATIGLPYLMLSTTGPLVQAWFARRFAGTPSLGKVWRLYALSNVASMLALVLYPPLIEPAASTRVQSLGWSLGYGLFVVLAIASAWLATRPTMASAIAHAAPPWPTGPATRAPQTMTSRPRPRWHSRACGCCWRPPVRCCCWPSPRTSRRTLPRCPSCGCCRWPST
ncbi:MAG: hypothetical protein ACOVOG_11860, partial [Rubrivivax sp.]